MTLADAVVAHYGKGDLLARIETALRDAGKDPARLRSTTSPGWTSSTRAVGTPRASSPQLLPPAIDTELLDIGSGLGGPARFLAATRGCRVVGIDLTPEYVDVAGELTRRCGLADRVRFLTADAVDLPFADASFAAAYTQHAAMNVRDKKRLYAEIARVLRPGGTFVAYDILQGPGGAVSYPTPWSADGTTSFLVDPAGLRRHLAEAGLDVLEERDRRAESLAWFKARAAAAAAKGGPPPLSLRLVLGPLFQDAFANLIANLEAATVVPTFVRAVRR